MRDPHFYSRPDRDRSVACELPAQQGKSANNTTHATDMNCRPSIDYHIIRHQVGEYYFSRPSLHRECVFSSLILGFLLHNDFRTVTVSVDVDSFPDSDSGSDVPRR